MHARVTELHGLSQAEMSSDLRYFEDQILPRVEEIPGMDGGLVLLDRAKGNALVITLWHDVESLTDSREEAATLRELAFQRMNLVSAPAVREYEVAAGRLAATVQPART